MRSGSIAIVLLAVMNFSACSSVVAHDDAVKNIIIKPVLTESIDILWRNNVDQRHPAAPFGFSKPVAIHTEQGDRVVACGQDHRVRMYDAVSGAELARVALGAACESGGLQLSNGLVVVGDLGGTLLAIHVGPTDVDQIDAGATDVGQTDIDQTKVVWQIHLSSALVGHPVAIGDDFLVQTSNNQLYRFNQDGQKVWSYSGLLGGLSMHLTPSPVVHQGRVYAVFSNADVVALQADTGNFVWKRQLLLSNKASVMSKLKVPLATPLLISAAQSGRDEDVLLVSVFQGDLSFLSLLDGSTLSTRNISLKSTPLLIGDVVFVADSKGAVSAMQAGNGETMWKQQISNGELTGPVLWQGNLWVADDQAVVYRLSKAGKMLARIDLNGRIDRMPVVSKYGVLVRNSLGTLYMLH